MFIGRKLARNVVAMATGDAPAEAAETPEIVKTILEAVRNCCFIYTTVYYSRFTFLFLNCISEED